MPTSRRFLAGFTVIVALAGIDCTRRPPAAQPSNDSTSTPAESPATPLRDYTVTLTAYSEGAVPGPQNSVTIASSATGGTGQVSVTQPGNPPQPGPEVPLRPEELQRLGELLGSPAFVNARSTPPGGEGDFTDITVRAGGTVRALSFYRTVPPAVAPVVQEIGRLRGVVMERAVAAGDAGTGGVTDAGGWPPQGQCATDAECSLAVCGCHCYARAPRDATPICEPARCFAAPCGREARAVCDAATHRCVVR